MVRILILEPFNFFSGEVDQEDLSSHSKSLKSLERQIFMETLRYEQERLQLVSMKNYNHQLKIGEYYVMLHNHHMIYNSNFYFSLETMQI